MSLEGQQLGRYRILRLLGSGGMGDVYLAEDARIEQQVAIKVIRAEVSPYPDAQASQGAARLFQREAKAIVKLDHPHILPLYDYGEERLGNTTLIYLVMPYRQEGSLSDWLKLRGQAGLLAPQEIAHLVGQAASALQHAHDRQIIHQDVKPSNFLLRHRQETPTRPDLLLADFGIARFATATASASQSIRGTPTYMAPEQWEGHPVPATDQYALAVMAYELLTGRPPFQGAPGPLMYQHLMTSPPPPSSVNPRLSGELDAVLLHALAKRPEQRFASMTAFATAFQQAVQHIKETNAPTRMSAVPTPAGHGDIRAALAISTAEAQTGTTRTLTLPGGRRVTVSIPAGARDGQVMRLDGLGDVSAAGGATGALILTLLVKTAEESPPFAQMSATSSAPTAQSSLGRPGEMTSVAQAEQRAPVMPADRASRPPETVTAQRPFDRPQATLQPPQRGLSRRTVVVGLAGLAVVGVAGGGLAWLAGSHAPSVPLSIGTMLYIYRGHSDWVFALGWSPDGKRIASGSGDRTVQVWDASDGGHLFTYCGHSGIVNALAWSPDGRRIASGSGDSTVQLWDATDGGHLFTYRGHSDWVFALGWSPDGKRIASGGSDKTVQVWNVTDGGNVFTYRGHSGIVNTLGWSPDGKHIASGSYDNTVQVWDATDGGHLFTYRGHSGWVYVLAWSPDGKRIASGSGDHSVQVWDATDGGHLFTYRGHSNTVYTVAWSPDGKRIASGSGDQTVQVWQAG